MGEEKEELGRGGKQERADLNRKERGVIIIVIYLLPFQMAVTHAYTQNVHRLFTGQMIADMSPDSFVLLVDRSNIVDSTVLQLIRSDESNFKKPLKVRFYFMGNFVWGSTVCV
jgi:hypothetical protein